MRTRQYVAYYRVSSPKQGTSGLGLEGQRLAVRQFVDQEGGNLVAEFSEVRSGLKSAGRQLREALRICRMRRAILTVAMVDRLSRRMALTSALMDSDIKLAVADSPNASRVILHLKAAVAEDESRRISQRIKAALSEARKRGVKLGHVRPLEDMRAMARLGQREWRAQTKARAMEIAPFAWKLKAEGKSSQAIAAELNWRNVPTPQGRRWYSSGVLRILRRTEAEFPDLAAAVAARPNHRVIHALERAEGLAPFVWRLRMLGMPFADIADELNREGISTCRGRTWCRDKVRNVLKRARSTLEPGPELADAMIGERRRRNSTAWARRAAPIAWKLLTDGISLVKIARELERRQIATARGGHWHADEVKTVLQLTRSEFPAAHRFVMTAARKRLAADRRKLSPTAARAIVALRKKGSSCEAVAEKLNEKRLMTATNGRWSRGSVIRALSRIWVLATFDAAA